LNIVWGLVVKKVFDNTVHRLPHP